MAEQIVLLIKLDDGTVKEALVSVEKKSKKTASKMEKHFTDFGSKIKRSFIAAGVALAGAFAVREVVQATQKQEDAINQLNTALRNSGTFSLQSSRQFQVFANELQQITGTGDETILQLAALARQFTKTDEEARALTKSALDLSAGTGLSLEGSVKNLGRTLSGLTGELGESVSEIRTLTQAQLKAGQAIDVVGKKFEGFASAQARTTSGQLRLLSANFGDLLENIGGAILSSPRVAQALGTITGAVKTLSDAIADTSGEPLFVRSLRNARAEVAVELLNLDAQIQETEDRLANVDPLAATRLEQGLVLSQARAEELRNEIKAIEKDLSTAVRNSKAGTGAGGLNPQEQAQRIQFQQLLGQATSARIQAELQGISQLGDVEERNAARARLLAESKLQTETDFETRRLALAQQFNDRRIVSQTELNNLLVQLEQEKNMKLQTLQMQLGTSSDISFENLKQATLDAFSKMEVSAESVGQTLASTFVTGFGAAMNSIGSALGRGQNALEAFGNSIFQTLGSLASMLGQFFILVGIGMTATTSLLGLSGGSAIAAGIGLQIFGGFLSAMGGGGTVAGAGGAGEGGGGGTGEGVSGPTIDDIENQKQNVVVNIRGDVLDSRESAIRISEILQSQYSSDGIEVVRG